MSNSYSIAQLMNQPIAHFSNGTRKHASESELDQLRKMLNCQPMSARVAERPCDLEEPSGTYPYDLFPMPNQPEHPRFYPRPVPTLAPKFPDLYQDLAEDTGLRVTEVERIIHALFLQLKRRLRAGARVEIPSLGALFTTLMCDELPANYDDMPLNLRIARIIFAPTDELQHAMIGVQFIRYPYFKGESLTWEQRSENILNYLEANSFITLSYVREVNRCSHTLASNDLRKLLQQEKLVSSRVGSLTIYALNKKAARMSQ